jgi:hypothetical protein
VNQIYKTFFAVGGFVWGERDGPYIDYDAPYLTFDLRGNAANYVRYMNTRIPLPANWELV